MKKILLPLALLTIGFVNAQNIFTENFSGTTADIDGAGWNRTNVSNPVGASTWIVPTAANTAFVGGGYSGGDTSFILVNYNSTTGAGIISNWLISPTIQIQNGDVITFWSRKGGDNTTTIYPDNLQFRISTAGDNSIIPSIDENDLGDFTTLATEINPNQDTTSYPFDWTQYSYTVTGLTGITDCKLAFRYYVTDGGPSGNNSDIIGVDDLSIDRPLSTDAFFKNNFTIFPNPVKDIVNISNTSNLAIESAKITDVNGRTVKEVRNFETLNQINISELNTGIYFLKVTTSQGTGTTQLVKN